MDVSGVDGESDKTSLTVDCGLLGGCRPSARSVYCGCSGAQGSERMAVHYAMPGAALNSPARFGGSLGC